MEKIINVVSLAGWAYLLLGTGMRLFVDRDSYLESDIGCDLWVLRAVQIFQSLEIVLILLGKSKGSVVGSFFQILGRNIVTLVFMSEQSNRLRFAMVVIIWSMADVNRYLYYLFKSNPITGFLRYNSFLLLYPVGVFGEMLIINDFIKIHSETLSEAYVYAIRGIQLSIVLGMLFLYKYMLSSRKKYLATLNKAPEGPEVETKRETAKSPRKEAKRD